MVLVQDAFTSWYEPRVVLAVLDLMRAIGFRPFSRLSAQTESRCTCMAFSAPSLARHPATLPCCATWLLLASSWSAWMHP